MDFLLSSSVITSVLWSGISLVTTDLVFDLRYVLAHPDNMPSRRQEALDYYRWLLKPRISPIPYPGWIFAALCSFYLLVIMPNIYHSAMALFYSPICMRYAEILRGVGDVHALRDWHWIVYIRFVLLALGISSLHVHSSSSSGLNKVTEY